MHLELVAQAHSRHMALDAFFDHDNPYGMGLQQRMDAVETPFWGWLAENIAAGQSTPAEVMDDWMNSPGHRQNIMSIQVTHIGIGVYAHPTAGIYWTQCFALFPLGDEDSHDWLEPDEVPIP